MDQAHRHLLLVKDHQDGGKAGLMSKLTDGLPVTGTDPTLAALDTTREPQQAQPGPQLVTVYVVNGTRTSAGARTRRAGAAAAGGGRAGPPAVRGVYGSRPPNEPDPAPTAKAFTGVHDPFPPRAGTRHGISN